MDDGLHFRPSPVDGEMHLSFAGGSSGTHRLACHADLDDLLRTNAVFGAGGRCNPDRISLPKGNIPRIAQVEASLVEGLAGKDDLLSNLAISRK